MFNRKKDPVDVSDPAPLDDKTVTTTTTMDAVDTTTTPLLVSSSYKSYRRRWYILFLFAGLTLHQSWVYCTYGPITSAVKHAYGWSDSMVAMTANAGTAAYLVFTWPVRRTQK